MRFYILLLIILTSCMYACNKDKNMMTKTEIELINNASESTPFYVLQTTVPSDSLFLRTKCQDFTPENIADDENLQLLIRRMRVTLDKEEGVGLAAPQIGIGRNLFLFMRIDKPENPIQVAINPKITQHPDTTICFIGDGCLSIPDKSGNSIRYPWVEVEYYDEKGILHKERLSGYSRKSDFTGIIFQHEFDHLQGILFTDKLYPNEEELFQIEN